MSSKGIPFKFELQGVNLNDYWGVGNPETCLPIHDAELFISGEEIFVEVYYKLATRLGDRFGSWYRKDCTLGVAHYMRAMVPQHNGRIRIIKFDNSKCIGFNTGGNRHENGVHSIRINLDKVDIQQEIVPPDVTFGEFYLNEAGMLLASKFYGPLLNTEEMKYEFGSDARCNEFDFNGLKYSFQLGAYLEKNNRIDKSVTIHKEPYLHIECVGRNVDSDEMFRAASLICSACSFFLLSEIDYSVGRVYTGNTSYENYKVARTVNVGRGVGLWVLGYQHPIETFLSSKWHETVKSDGLKFQRIVTKYLLATHTAASTKFLLLFTVLEILKGQETGTKTNHEFAVPAHDANKRFKQALQLILENFVAQEHESFREKWNSTILPMMKRKSLRSQFHVLFVRNGLMEPDFKYPWKDINMLRTRVIHGSMTAEDDSKLEDYNDFIFKLAGVLILGSMGITDWHLRK
jgi:hypothetical protein